MFCRINRILLTIFSCIIILSVADAGNFLIARKLDSQPGINSSESKGYRDVVVFMDEFFAVGTDGRIDCFSKSAKKLSEHIVSKYKLNCAYSNNKILIAGGDEGTIIYSTDGKNFNVTRSGISENINDIKSKNGLILAGADKGKILVSKDGKTWSCIQTAAEGNIMSLSVKSNFIIGVTDAGEIIKSFNGTDWDIKNYNKEYAGYNEPASFKKIIIGQNNIVIIGVHSDGSPSILFSTLGNVWAERIPIYNDSNGNKSYLAKEPNAVTYDPLMDEFIIACNSGELLSLPSCSKCNKFIKVSDINLEAVIIVDDKLVIAGDDYSFIIHEL